MKQGQRKRCSSGFSFASSICRWISEGMAAGFAGGAGRVYRLLYARFLAAVCEELKIEGKNTFVFH